MRRAFVHRLREAHHVRQREKAEREALDYQRQAYAAQVRARVAMAGGFLALAAATVLTLARG